MNGDASNADVVNVNEKEEVKQVLQEETFVSKQLTVIWLLLSVTVCLTYWLQKYRISKILPPSIAAMVLGMLVGIIINATDKLSPPEFSAEAFLYGLLPPIVFAAGFSMKKRAFFENFGSIVTFAVLGTVISTIVFSLGTLMLISMGLVSRSELGHSPTIMIFLYGTLISAIDPVATLSVFSDMDAPPLLYNLVFGESVLNDAVAVVLFRTLQGLLGTEVHWYTVFVVALKFCVIGFGSLVVGIAVALACAFVLKNFNPLQDSNAGTHADGTMYEISIIFMGAYSSYLLAEVAELSGIVALFFSGIVHAHYSFHNISQEAQTSISKVAHTLGFLCEIFVFEYLGLQVALIPQMEIDVGILVSGIPLCLISRAANIFPLAYIVNRFRKYPIPYSVQVMQFLCGLRGAVAYALAAYLTKIRPSTPLEPGTLIIVVLSTILFGGATGPVMRRLQLQGADDLALRRMHYHDPGDPSHGTQNEVAALEMSWERWDGMYLKPYFGGRTHPAGGDEGSALLGSSSENMDVRDSPPNPSS